MRGIPRPSSLGFGSLSRSGEINGRIRGRPPFPVERRPSSLVCALFNPSRLEREKGSKLLARGALGPFALGVGSFSPRAPRAVQMERRLAWRTIACLPKDQPRSLLRLLEQGPESQSASEICSGGVSAVISSSDLDGLTFHPLRVCWHRSNRALPSREKKPKVEPTCLMQAEGVKSASR